MEIVTWLILTAFNYFMIAADHASLWFGFGVKVLVGYGLTFSQAYLVIFGVLMLLVLLALWRATTVIVKF